MLTIEEISDINSYWRCRIITSVADMYYMCPIDVWCEKTFGQEAKFKNEDISDTVWSKINEGWQFKNIEDAQLLMLTWN